MPVKLALQAAQDGEKYDKWLNWHFTWAVIETVQVQIVILEYTAAAVMLFCISSIE